MVFVSLCENGSAILKEMLVSPALGGLKMSIDLQLEDLTVAEKLEAMEAIWASLCRSPLDFTSPTWHAQVLAERRRRLEAGEATVSDWAAAKSRLLNLGK